MALRTLHPAGFLQGLFPSAQASLRPSIAAPLLERCRTAVLPSIWIPIPGIVSGLWEGILRAVPKKKTSHMKKRHRFMHNNKLKDVTALNKCSSCGRTKRAHVLCPYCVASTYCLVPLRRLILRARWMANNLRRHSTMDEERFQQAHGQRRDWRA